MNREFTVDELIGHRAASIGTREPVKVLEALTVEGFPDDQVPLKAADALRKFRKMSTRARSARVHRVLEFVVQESRPASSGSGDRLLALLNEILPPTTHPTRRTRFVHGLVALIDERIALSHTPAAPPQTSVFRWTSRSSLVEECWCGPVVIGTISCVRIETDSSTGLYDATFGTGVHAQKFPGQHQMDVAKRRVEDRYREWVRLTLPSA